jgi:hypothetical protein
MYILSLQRKENHAPLSLVHPLQSSIFGWLWRNWPWRAVRYCQQRAAKMSDISSVQSSLAAVIIRTYGWLFFDKLLQLERDPASCAPSRTALCAEFLARVFHSFSQIGRFCMESSSLVCSVLFISARHEEFKACRSAHVTFAEGRVHADKYI